MHKNGDKDTEKKPSKGNACIHIHVNCEMITTLKLTDTSNTSHRRVYMYIYIGGGALEIYCLGKFQAYSTVL